MKKIEIERYTLYSLELILSEANKLSEQILKSISECVNKSFILFTLYSSIFSFSFVKVVGLDFSYLILLIGTIISNFIIRKNIFPNYISFNGVLPENIFISYYNDFSNEELEKELLATQIESYNCAMNKNRTTIEEMSNRFSTSIYCMLLFFVLFGIVFLISFIECPNT